MKITKYLLIIGGLIYAGTFLLLMYKTKSQFQFFLYSCSIVVVVGLLIPIIVQLICNEYLGNEVVQEVVEIPPKPASLFPVFPKNWWKQSSHFCVMNEHSECSGRYIKDFNKIGIPNWQSCQCPHHFLEP